MLLVLLKDYDHANLATKMNPAKLQWESLAVVNWQRL